MHATHALFVAAPLPSTSLLAVPFISFTAASIIRANIGPYGQLANPGICTLHSCSLVLFPCTPLFCPGTAAAQDVANFS
jgi:hypothetical protein